MTESLGRVAGRLLGDNDTLGNKEFILFTAAGRGYSSKFVSMWDGIPDMSQCIACSKPLTVEIDFEEDDEHTLLQSASEIVVPDSVELPCGCHFHWCVFSQAFPIPRQVFMMDLKLKVKNVGNVY